MDELHSESCILVELCIGRNVNVQILLLHRRSFIFVNRKKICTLN